MIASRWVIEKIIEHIGNKNYADAEKLFRRYGNDTDLQKIHKELLAYRNEPTPAKLSELKKHLSELQRIRKIESSGGTRLWFGDRRVKGSRTSR
jgi:hypothetical protein